MSLLADAARRAGEWYGDWQSTDHVRVLDRRYALSDASLVRNYEAFNDVCLLNERLDRASDAALLEVGCATGEFYRYLRVKRPRVRYYGVDIARAAIARAREKYPAGRFFAGEPGVPVADALRSLDLPGAWEVVYAKDVVHHQTRPFDFLAQLLDVTADMLIMRLRTRDRGATVTDPDVSCQHHYQGWMPYIVINVQELIEHIRTRAPRSEIVVYRHHMVLGGQHNRFLPKECYLPETGTAETVVGVFSRTTRPGEVTLENRKDPLPRYSVTSRLNGLVTRMLGPRVFRRGLV